jgi:chromosome partitioning protein
MSKTICVTNQKGGVGKTTTVVTLAHGLALDGKRVLIIDLDPQGQSAIALGIDPEPGVFNLLINRATSSQQWLRRTRCENLRIIPGDRTTASAQILMNAEGHPVDAIASAIKPLVGEYDYIIFDTSPSVGGLQERAIWASNYVIIPAATEFLSVESLGKTLETMLDLTEQKAWKGKLLGILPTFYDQVTKESAAAIEHINGHYVGLALSPIRRATILRECAADGLTLWEKDPNSKVADDYRRLIATVKKA